MPSYNFRIRKITDRQLIDKMREITDKCGFEQVSYSIPIVNHRVDNLRDTNWFTDPVLVQALEMGSMLIAGATLWVQRGIQVSVSREAGNSLSDAAALHIPDNLQGAAGVTFPIIKATQDTLEEITPPQWDLMALGSDVKAYYEARDQHLARQEREVSNFFTKMADFSRQMTQEHRAKMDQLESDFAERQKKLDEQHQQRMNELNQRDAEFDKKKAEFDLQESRGMRRKLREEQKKELQELVKKFTLTPETEAKRTPIWVAAVVTIGALTIITLYLMFGQPVADQQGNLNYLLIARQITFSIATIAFIWFFIHWSNRWFQRHADEELRLKRLSLDLDRASWVFEMILDWQKETKQAFPTELLKHLAKNLYAADGIGGDDMTKADLLASLLGAVANLKIKGGGAEMEFDRKSLKEIEKST